MWTIAAIVLVSTGTGMQFLNKLISKNNKLSTEQLLEYICENYPNILEQSLDVIDENDDDVSIKKKFSEILHLKLISG